MATTKKTSKSIPVLITTKHRGVFFGYADENDVSKDTIRLSGARNCIAWKRSIGGVFGLANVGPNVMCKLSGLAMPLRSMAPDVLAPWIGHAIEAFGPDRCLFASNFPVDGMHGSFDQLYSSYAAVTADLDDQARDKLFAANAERIYRLTAD